ncbi:AAA family ATPase [Pseudomonas sp. F1_0610]|uniref:AAA family ATPase n=1 Tax=Pseudomonas sp. F1_0610 TaxID=3114284 RepID=UPI0039C49FA0
MTKRFIITGGPGSGKSTLLAYLAAQGIQTSIEAGRAIIQMQERIGGSALPWRSPEKFAEQMLTWEVYSYELAKDDICLYDRGVPDILGYLNLSQLPIPEYLKKAAELYPYQPQVLIAPPWFEIYCQDEQRKQDYPLAVKTYQAMCDIYTELGYQLYELPKASVEERADFVHKVISLQVEN